ncbi:MAG: hypothetical protein ACR2IQ_01245, partial [Minisyncoccia bacterium]
NDPVDLVGGFTYQNIKNISISPDGLSYVYLQPKAVGVDVVSSSFNNKKDTVLFSSPLSEWVIDNTNKSIILTTKPTGLFEGYSYTTENSGGPYSKTLSGYGLTEETTDDGLYKIYSLIKNNIPNLYILQTKTNNTFNTGINTFSEKCVFAKTIYYCAVPSEMPTQTYPDAWYQGIVSFNDNLWSIEPATQKTTLINNLSTNIGGMDATNLQIQDDGKKLYFIDKKTSLLWAYEL